MLVQIFNNVVELLCKESNAAAALRATVSIACAAASAAWLFAWAALTSDVDSAAVHALTLES